MATRSNRAPATGAEHINYFVSKAESRQICSEILTTVVNNSCCSPEIMTKDIWSWDQSNLIISVMAAVLMGKLKTLIWNIPNWTCNQWVKVYSIYPIKTWNTQFKQKMVDKYLPKYLQNLSGALYFSHNLSVIWNFSPWLYPNSKNMWLSSQLNKGYIKSKGDGSFASQTWDNITKILTVTASS